MSRLVVLGATGMLGSRVLHRALARGFDASGTTTDLTVAPKSLLPHLHTLALQTDPLDPVTDALGSGDVVINCIGLIKQRIDERRIADRALAIELNAALPHALAVRAERQGFRVIQIATDCVFEGDRGSYSEDSPHDAVDVYGQSKSLGEVPSDNVMHIRSSIVGRELRSHKSLVDWALRQPHGAEIAGYTNHYWNGVSTGAFADVALGIATGGSWQPGTVHLVPADTVSKFELLEVVLEAFGRTDVRLVPTLAPTSIDRTLVTTDPARNLEMWRAGGHPSPPTVAEILRALPHEETPR